MPSWAVQRRAKEIEAYETKIKEPKWSEEELRILERNAHKQPEAIRRHLKKCGFNRTYTGIFLKRKRLRLLKNLEGYSATNLAECFGIDPHGVTSWISKGYLKAKRRGTARTKTQGGDSWWIKEKDIKKFIIESIGLIDIRKVDKFWFVDMLT